MNKQTELKRWYNICSEPDCMKKFSKDHDVHTDHLDLTFSNPVAYPKDKYNLILIGIFSTNLYCMSCAHKHAHRVYYNRGNPEPYNINFIRNIAY